MDGLIKAYLYGMLALCVLGPASVGLLLVKEPWAEWAGMLIGLAEILWLPVSLIVGIYAFFKPARDGRIAALASYYLAYSTALILITVAASFSGADIEDMSTPFSLAASASYIMFYVTVAFASVWLLSCREDKKTDRPHRKAAGKGSTLSRR